MENEIKVDDVITLSMDDEAALAMRHMEAFGHKDDLLLVSEELTRYLKETRGRRQAKLEAMPVIEEELFPENEQE